MSDFLQWAMIVGAIASIPIYGLLRDAHATSPLQNKDEEPAKNQGAYVPAAQFLVAAYPRYRGGADPKPHVGIDVEYGSEEHQFGSARKLPSLSYTKYGELPPIQSNPEHRHVKSQFSN